jgi:hypothetical protein
MRNFLLTLFDEFETTCFSRDCFDTDLSKLPDKQDLFFSINPIHETRADKNVTSFRNFLIELDSIPLSEQIQYVTSKIPIDMITSIVYSGSKSYHFIISLETPLPDLETYQQVARRLHKLVPASDKTQKNPSRFSRLPFRTRPDTGLEQTLIRLGSRVDTASLIALLPCEGLSISQATKKPEQAWISVNLTYALEQPDEFMRERGFAGRNHFFFYVFNRLKDEGLNSSEIRHYIDYMYANLKNKNDFTIAEAYSAARIK